MGVILIPRKYLSFACAKSLRVLCRPLFCNTNIDLFRYVRSYSDGTYFTLSTDLEFENYILFDSKGKYNFDVEILHTMFDNLKYHKNKKICVFTEEIDKVGYWNGLWNEFNVTSCLNILERSNNYYERFGFLSRFNKNFYSFYINHFDMIEKFISYFKEHGADLIKIGEKNKFFWSNSNTDYRKMVQNLKTKRYEENKCLAALQGNFRLKRNYMSNGNIKTTITQRELECLHYVSQGYSYKEIGNILQVTDRTIETHLQHIKSKLSVYSRSQLLKIYHLYTNGI